MKFASTWAALGCGAVWSTCEYHGVPHAGSGSVQPTGAPDACSRTSGCVMGVTAISPDASAWAIASEPG